MNDGESDISDESEINSVFSNSKIQNPYVASREVYLKPFFREDTHDYDGGLSQHVDVIFQGHILEKRIIHSKSMVDSFAIWLGIDNSYREADRWKEHIRRRRTHNRLVGQYKEDAADDIFDAIFAQQTPQISYTTYKSPIIDPLSKHSRNCMNRQISKISTSSMSKKMSRTINPARIATKESVFKLAFNSVKNAFTPTSIKENLTWPHSRSVTMLQIKNEATQIGAAIDEDAILDDVFFNDCDRSEFNSDAPESVFSCKLERNKNDHNNKGDFSGMSKIPSSYLAKVRGGRRIGLSAFITEAEYRKSRLDSAIKNQINSLEDHRPYFTFWVTFVQVVCYIFAILAYDLAPFGISTTVVTEDVLLPNLAIESSSYLEDSNVWLGLRQSDLIHMGAKYAGCMRKDKTIRKYIERDQMSEKKSGCCIRLDGSGCYQTSEDNCSYPFGRGYRKSTITMWKTWKNSTGPFGRSSGSVCHQDPRFCLRPPTPLEQQNWPDDITNWPLCLEAYSHSDLTLEDTDHMTCDITGQPCCTGIKGECLITTREDCAFRRGYYHQEAFLCSQVACLEEVCGMVPFFNSDVPDQFYRLFISLFIHAGVIHLLVTIIFQMIIMRDLEKLAGSIRISIIYIFSGIAGSLTSAIFLPYVVEAGPSGSQFGLLSCLFVEVIQNRYILKRPVTALLKLSTVLISLFLLGLMPMVDNFAHLGGFIFGFLLSFAFLPYITFNVMDERTKIRLVLSCLCLSIILFSVLLIIFYVVPIYDCPFCHYINCLPLTSGFCNNMRLTTEI